MVEKNKRRPMLGRGERLAERIDYRSGFGSSAPPYSWGEQKTRLIGQLEAQNTMMSALDDAACPFGQCVSKFTLHPQFISRTSFPRALLDQFELKLIGSRPLQVKPDKGKGSDSDLGAASTMLFVSGHKDSFEALANSIEDMTDGPSAEDLQKIEQIELFSAEDRLQGRFTASQSMLEVVLHLDASWNLPIESLFNDFAEANRVRLDVARTYQTRGLLFLPAIANRLGVNKLAEFTFVRAIRPIPKLRIIDRPHILRGRSGTRIQLPVEDAVDPNCKIALFDGGLHDAHPFEKWVSLIEPGDHHKIGGRVDQYIDHGTAVTSAALFGHVDQVQLPRPFTNIDHYRVLGDQVTDTQLYDVMLYVDEILTQTNYPLASFSIGPNEIVGEDKVTAWTSMLDDHFGESETVATIAVGNEGHLDWPKSRIQIPSDCVNALAVGASDSLSGEWKRADYSSVGPGRHPGVVKPDLVHFGGVPGNEFRFLFPGPCIAEGTGTSYSTPAVIRIAAGLRAYFGNDLQTQVIRALLIHTADSNSESEKHEVGWGQINTDIDDIVTCSDGQVRIVYQGRLNPAQVLRTPIPVPEETLEGMVKITATFCYGCKTDPHTPGEYTRAGLDVTYRPNRLKLAKDKEYPAPASFFKRHERSNEDQLRKDAHKWDTVMHSFVNSRGSSLKDPVFEIHYLAREPGSDRSPLHAERVPYALIVTVESKRTPDLYERVEARYRNQLTAMTPRIDIPTVVRV